MSVNIEQIKAMLERTGKTNLLQKQKVDLDKERLQLEATVNLEEEYKDYVERDPVYSKLVNRNAGLSIARHFAKWGAEHFRDTTKKVSDDLEEAAKQFVGYDMDTDDLRDYEIGVSSFIAGAKWQKEQDEKEQADLFTIVALDAAQRAKEQMMIQWTGNNLKDVIEFTGKSPRFNEWFKSWDDYEDYVRRHGNIFKMFNDDGSHLEVPVGAWIVKTPDKRCVASKFTLKQPESEKIAAAYQLGLADKEKKMMKGLRSYCLEQMELFPGEQDVARATRAVYYDIIGYLDNYERR